MTRFVQANALIALGIALGACGGAPQKSVAQPSAPEAAQAGYGQQADPSQQAPGAPQPMPPSSTQSGAPSVGADAATKSTSLPRTESTPSTAPRERDPSLRRAVESAQRELELAGSDCAAACRALGSMERATARLCTLEEASCEEVRLRLLRSRERVRTSCGGCPGGPSVNPDAPIPSR